VIATYSRFPRRALPLPHSDTVAGGFGRELVALNFPFALVGIALVGLAWPRLHGALRAAGVVAIALCAVVYFAVDQSNLDAKPLNAVPALGLALAVVLAFVVGVPSRPKSKRGDRCGSGLPPCSSSSARRSSRPSSASSSTAFRSSAGSTRPPA
jgi:hypothetical protein